MFRHVLARASEDRLLLVLLAALAPLLWLTPEPDWALHQLVDWKTVGALAGLMILSRGLEGSFLKLTLPATSKHAGRAVHEAKVCLWQRGCTFQ